MVHKREPPEGKHAQLQQLLNCLPQLTRSNIKHYQQLQRSQHTGLVRREQVHTF